MNTLNVYIGAYARVTPTATRVRCLAHPQEVFAADMEFCFRCGRKLMKENPIYEVCEDDLEVIAHGDREESYFALPHRRTENPVAIARLDDGECEFPFPLEERDYCLNFEQEFAERLAALRKIADVRVLLGVVSYYV